MQPIKSYSIWKNTKPVEDTPEGIKRHDYSLSAKIIENNTEIYRDIGKGYINETKEKKIKYIGIQMQNEYTTKEGNKVDGYVIITDAQYKALKQAYDDWQIHLRKPNYPTPTEKGIVMEEPLDITEDDLNTPTDFLGF